MLRAMVSAECRPDLSLSIIEVIIAICSVGATLFSVSETLVKDSSKTGNSSPHQGNPMLLVLDLTSSTAKVKDHTR